MKSARNTLLSIVFASGFSGCISAGTYSINEMETIEEHSERFLIELGVGTQDYCTAEVFMAADSYLIDCSFKPYFVHTTERGDYLVNPQEHYWYWDRNSDGEMDEILHNAKKMILTDSVLHDLKEYYQQMLSYLKKDDVHRTWLRRFTRGG